MKRLLVCAVAFGCGGAYSTDVVPGLPGDGSANVASPREPGAKGKRDPWAGREDLISTPGATQAQLVPLPPIDRFVLANGLRVVLVRAPAGAVSVQLGVKAGERDAPRDKVGIATLTAAVLSHGARGRDVKALEDAADLAGVTFGASASYEATRVSCLGGSAGLKSCLQLVADMAAAPTFAAKELTSVQTELAGSARQQRQDGAVLAGVHFLQLLWGDDNPRGWPMSEASLSGISRAEVVAWHKARFRPANAVLVVSADVDPAKLKRDADAAFRGWAKGAAVKTTDIAEPKTGGIQIRLVDRAGTTAHVRVGQLGIARNAPDFFAAIAINEVLGAGPGSRLSRVLPGGNASSTLDRHTDRGSLLAGAGAKPELAVATAKALLTQIRKLKEDGPSQAELDRALSALIGEYLVQLESPRAIADTLLSAELSGLDETYVRDYPLALGKVSRDAAIKAARDRLDPGNVAIVIVGPADKIERQLADAGWTYKKVAATDPIGPYETESSQSSSKDAIAVLDKALEAKGGFDRLAKVKTFVWEGNAKLTIGGQTAPASVVKTFVIPDKLRLDMAINGGQLKASTVFDGANGWASQQPQGQAAQVVALPKGEVELGRGQIWRDNDFILLRHKAEGARARKLDDRKVGAAPHHAIEITSKDGKQAVVLLIDKKTHMVAGMDFTEQGLEVKERYARYKKVDGIQVAQERSTDSDQLKLEVAMTKASFETKVDPSTFAKPK